MSAGDLPTVNIVGWVERSTPRRQVLTGSRLQPAGHLTPLIGRPQIANRLLGQTQIGRVSRSGAKVALGLEFA
jgi:hypothetical protein